MAKSIYKFYADCGRMGDLEGIFVATQGEVNKVTKTSREVYFGECLGKHSEISFKVKPEQITHVSSDAELVKLFEQHELETGYNPVAYYTDAVEDGLYN